MGGADVHRLLVPELVDIVGRPHVLTDDDVTAAHAVDWTGRFRGDTPAVVRPGTVGEVSAVVAACDRAGVALVPQGGNTGLVGGGVPLAGEVILLLTRLRRLDPVDVVSGQVTVGAGVTLAALQAHVAGHGWAYAVDFAARDAATVGGTIATNAGGVHVLRHGGTRRQVLGVEAVLAGGQVLSHLGGLVKDNTGYDLAGLLCGSEGTLAVVTAARLALVPAPVHRVVALVALPSVAAAVDLVARWRRRLDSLQAAELFLDDGLALVCRLERLPPPMPVRSGAYLLLEAAGRVDPTDEVVALLAAEPSVVDSALAGDSDGCRRLWRYREAHTTAINRLGPPRKYDVTVPAGALAELVGRVPAVVAAVAPGATTWLFGHVGDGNIHVNVTLASASAGAGMSGDALDGAPGGVVDDALDDALDEAVFGLAAGLGGSISAEHGIGTAKRRWLALNRSPQEIDAFRAIKDALDPRGTLNPNVLLP